MPKGKKYGADETGKTFGPGHNGWHEVRNLDGSTPTIKGQYGPFYNANGAFAAAAAAGLSLTNARVYPITCPACVYEIDTGRPDHNMQHDCDTED